MKTFTSPKGWLLLLSPAVLLLLWWAASLWIDAPIILPSPGETAKELILLIGSKTFYTSLGATLLRGVWGFLIPLGAGLITGLLSGKYPWVETGLSPLLTVIKSTPILSIILLAMIWFPIGQVPLFVCFLTTFPIITEGMSEGMRRIDPAYIELARIYAIGRKKRLWEIYLPGVVPFLLSSMRSTLGLTWKIIITAEVLAQPPWGVGTAIQNANVNLFTARVFAWTGIAILLSWGSGLLMDRLTKRIPGAAYEA